MLITENPVYTQTIQVLKTAKQTKQDNCIVILFCLFYSSMYCLNKELHRELLYQLHFLLTLCPLYTNKECRREEGGLINLISRQRAC